VELVVSGPEADRIGDALATLCLSPLPSWIAVAREVVRSRAEDAQMRADAAAREGIVVAGDGTVAAETASAVAAVALDVSHVVPPSRTAAALEDLALAERAVLEDPEAARLVLEVVGELTGASSSELALEPPARRPRLRSPGRLHSHDVHDAGEVTGPGVPGRRVPLVAAEQLGMDVMTTLLVQEPTLVPPFSVFAGTRRGQAIGALVWNFESEEEAQNFRAGVLGAVARSGRWPAPLRPTVTVIETADACLEIAAEGPEVETEIA